MFLTSFINTYFNGVLFHLDQPIDFNGYFPEHVLMANSFECFNR